MARTPKAQALGNALRAQRERHGWTLRAFAQKLNREPGVVSRWETGDRTPRPEQVARMLTVLGVEEELYEEIITLTRDADAPIWMAMSAPEMRQQLRAFVDTERTADSIVDVSPLLIPGLFQTDAYIHGVMTGCGLLGEDEIERRSGIRVWRREVLVRDRPVRYRALIGEAALYQVIGSRDVVVEQLRHLLTMGRRPNICFQVVPRDIGWNPSLEGSFTMFETRNRKLNVHLETRVSGIFLHEERDVAPYRAAVDSLIDFAHSPDRSAVVIDRAIKNLESRA